MQLGVMRVEFRSSERVTITKPNQIKWKEPGDAKFSNFSASVEIALDISQHGTDFDLLDIPTPEGRRKLISHLSWERDRGKSLAKKNMVLEASGRLLCEACGFDFSLRYGALGTGYCEVHHEIPGSKGERKTKFKDLRILCSNCHRMIHKTDPMMSVEEFASKYIADAPHAPEN